MSLSDAIRSRIISECRSDPFLKTFVDAPDGQCPYPIPAMLMIEARYDRTAAGAQAYESNVDQCTRVIMQTVRSAAAYGGTVNIGRVDVDPMSECDVRLMLASVQLDESLCSKIIGWNIAAHCWPSV